MVILLFDIHDIAFGLPQATFEAHLTVEKGLMALSNSREVASKALAGNKTRHDFKRTPPMSTYLFAMVVSCQSTSPVVSSLLCALCFICHIPSTLFHLPFSIFPMACALFYLPYFICHISPAIFRVPYSICHIVSALFHLPYAIYHIPAALFCVPYFICPFLCALFHLPFPSSTCPVSFCAFICALS